MTLAIPLPPPGPLTDPRLFTVLYGTHTKSLVRVCYVSGLATDRLHLFPAWVDKVVELYLPYIYNEIRYSIIALWEVRVCMNMSESCVYLLQLGKCTVALMVHEHESHRTEWK